MNAKDRVQLIINLHMVMLTGEIVIAKLIERGALFYDGCGELRAAPSERQKNRIRVGIMALGNL